MADTDPETSGDQEREQDGPQDPNRGREIRGECHDAVTGELYAVALTFSAAHAPDSPPLPDRISGVFKSAGLDCGVSVRRLGSETAFDGDHRI